MNSIEITLERIELPGWLGEYRRFIERLLRHISIDNWEISILLCDGEMIRTLNASYRNKDEVTDVLSFPQSEGENPDRGQELFPAGDIVIAIDRIEEQAGEFGVPFMQELYRMTVHGILHLAGHRHASTDEDEPMLKLQEKIVSELTGEKDH